MAKLFALEDADLEGGAEVELEAAPEVGEVADVQVEVEADAGEMIEVAAGVDEGIGAADQLEQVEEVVEQAAEGEGLDPVAAEAIKIAVEAICARIGANPKSVYSLYATENFQSASSRKANTKYALEGLGEFLKNLWEKIKAAIQSLWAKVKAFWDKHISSLGRSLKALESMKTKVSALKGSQTHEIVEVPGSLSSIFPTKATLGVEEITDYMKTLGAAYEELDGFKMMENFSGASKLQGVVLALANAKAGFDVVFGSETKPMPGGGYFKWEFKLEEDSDEGVKTGTLTVDEDHGTFNDGNKKAQMDIASKEQLKALITGTTTVVKALMKYRDKIEQRNKAVTNNFKAIDNELKGMGEREDRADAKYALRAYSLVMTKVPAIEAKLLGLHMTFVKGVLGYTATCMKHYKA